ncbi:winged helix-turn-helix transcriptional regulator [Paenibacillus sp. GSMTC-2017]|uniref:ArsR/SmtB family transcription factor n=1 Tax=Paenibacillus sp. GSMTC-2017 TaxID=2794350 RepID=UPI0018D5F918|nr:winged helix-turn-helix domain-containing protein [Paenibacillus sp. GSMTC-2017]MBH5320876.1 winged helix-turn-helix transcriptional regulator [Paenibacillus sp. GSMTC-2017]
MTNYQIDVTFEPLHEFVASLHTYFCRKSHKKLDLPSIWPNAVRQQLSPELDSLLNSTGINGEWKLTNLLLYLCPSAVDVESFLTWLDGLTVSDLNELVFNSGEQFPENMNEFRSRTLTIFDGWNEQYFRHIDPTILDALYNERDDRKKAMSEMSQEQFIDETTNGLLFTPRVGLNKLLLIPQYHFQPINIVYQFGDTTVCHYSARIYLDQEDFLSPHEFRVIRSIGEKSRLKILRYLHQGPRSFSEIVRHLNLSKGITHDHISKLRSAGLICAHIDGDTLTEYSLRSHALQKIQSKLNQYIEG